MSRIFGWAMLGAMLIGGAFGSEALAQDGMKVIKLEMDGRKARNRAGADVLKQLVALESFDLVCLNVAIKLNGTQPNAVLASTEDDNQRYTVACRPGSDRMGDYPMAPGVEYFLPNIGTTNRQLISLLAYPGSHTEQPFNSVDCVADPDDKKSALFRIRGFFTVDNKDLNDRREIELRPATYANEPAITRQAAAKCLR